ncbi:FMN reductase [Streptacidiphilus sp. PB12-B1b]|uniref:FMN reductase n=1 Tax=Streptacidiphilus sp. PB12-B1b TaxID=2705012 RepID=UPI0015FAF551|nr:FMN reductase [Streptacidiphilus sp. PB12-B1b]QMU77501.1 FMN reductase [Streptacidiphilus sp. PB12-B1b]
MTAAAPVDLAVISAGLGRPSSTRLLADRLAEGVRQSLLGRGREVRTRTVDLRELARPIADNLVTGFAPGALREAVEAVTGADAVIAVTPVFSASYSGLFKSFVDVLDNTALTGVPVLIAATGGTARHSLVLDHALRPLFSYLRAVVVPTGVYAATEDWGADGGSGEGSLPARIARAAGELADLVDGRPARTAPAGEDFLPFEQQLAALRPGA